MSEDTFETSNPDLAGNENQNGQQPAEEKVDTQLDGYMQGIFGQDDSASKKDGEEIAVDENGNPIDENALAEQFDADGNPIVKKDDQVTEISTVELKDGDFTKKLDITKDEDWDYLLQHANKGLNYERKLSEFNKQKEEITNHKNYLDTVSQQVAFNLLYLQNKGELKAEDFTEKPYDFFKGQFENEQVDLKAYNDHKRTIATRLNQLDEYSRNFAQTSKKFDAMTDKFKEKHSEVKDIQLWLKENVHPYHAPIQTLGMVEYPEDTLEMIWFYKNREAIMKEVAKRERIRIAKKSSPMPGGAKLGGAGKVSKLDSVIKSSFGNDDRELVS